MKDNVIQTLGTSPLHVRSKKHCIIRKLHIADNDIEFNQLAIIMSNEEKGMCLETQGSQMTLNPETFKAKVTSQSPLTLRGVGREQVEPILP